MDSIDASSALPYLRLEKLAVSVLKIARISMNNLVLQENGLDTEFIKISKWFKKPRLKEFLTVGIAIPYACDQFHYQIQGVDVIRQTLKAIV